MDIKDIQSGGPAALNPARDTRTAVPSTPPGTPDQPVDSVTMSDQARVFQQARLAALAVPDVHTDRVEALRRQLASGELRPDPARIAQALTAQGVLS
jgi:flagellar biosynthesis anti-sigma factor FlgM